ncbi:MAG TPA: hypothetical protein VLK82_08190 [Candidatus Tectomicrobia bacterium]|nr:hypothetical protein [Candidatus Tectomicrobia bacterium]
MAVAEDQLDGCLSTVPRKQAIFAGPLAVAPKRPLISAIHLTEAHENVLWLAGVETYCFDTDVAQHP